MMGLGCCCDEKPGAWDLAIWICNNNAAQDVPQEVTVNGDTVGNTNGGGTGCCAAFITTAKGASWQIRQYPFLYSWLTCGPQLGSTVDGPTGVYHPGVASSEWIWPAAGIGDNPHGDGGGGEDNGAADDDPPFPSHPGTLSTSSPYYYRRASTDFPNGTGWNWMFGRPTYHWDGAAWVADQANLFDSGSTDYGGVTDVQIFRVDHEVFIDGGYNNEVTIEYPGSFDDRHLSAGLIQIASIMKASSRAWTKRPNGTSAVSSPARPARRLTSLARRVQATTFSATPT
jgi:hypothetical protein